MAAVERRFDVNGYCLAGREWHDGAEHKVIACHGWLDNAASFDVLAPLLGNCHLLALDMPGHGLSDHKSPQATYNIWDDLLDILAVADTMGWKTFSLLGHSRGAILSVLLAAVMPERVNALVILDAILPRPVAVEDSAKQLRQFILQQRAVAGKKLPSYHSIDQAVTARSAAVGMDRLSAQMIVSRGLKKIADRYYWRNDPRLLTASAFKMTAAHNHAFVKALTVPYLFLVAEGGLAKQEDFKSVAKITAELQYTVLPGSHYFHMEQQAPLIASRINSFYKNPNCD